MRNKTSLFKRSLAGLLTLVLVLGMIPAVSWVAKAAEDDEISATNVQAQAEGNFITLPITIRDFAADGMLFEYNEVDRATFTARNADGTFTWTDPNKVTITDRLAYDQTGRGTNGAIDHGYREPYQAIYDPTSSTLEANEYTGIYVIPKSSSLVPGAWWYCLIIDENGNILKVLPAGEGSKDTFATDMKATYTLPDKSSTTPAYSVWTWRNPENLPYQNLLEKVTESNKNQYQIGFYNVTAHDYGSSTWVSEDKLNFYLGRKYFSGWTTPNSYGGYFVYSGDNVVWGFEEAYQSWKCIVCRASDGQVVDVIPPAPEGEKNKLNTYQYLNNSNYNFIMINPGDTASLDAVAHITTDNMSEYQIVTATCDKGRALFVERTITMHEANTRGFGLLFTKASDMFHELYDDPVTGEDYGTIAGSLLEDNDPTSLSGSRPNVAPSKTVYIWNEAETAENPKENHVSQELVYGTIRTGLVEKELDKNTKRPVYTQATVEYLADYMSKVMPYGESYNGNYYSFHVMGVKMFDANGEYVDINGENADDAVYDLAEMLRRNIKAAHEGEYALGKYTDSQTKYNNGGLRTYKDVTTWYDAAYFLLHNTWSDSDLDAEESGSDGYGMPTQYHSLHLVETTNKQGQTCYVFNAKYSNTYYGNGEIYNTPFGDYTAANRPYDGAFSKNSHTEATTSGVKLPHLRFDPLGPASMNGWQGYRKAGSMNTYGDLTGAKTSQDWSEYYDDTNYHLSLEGHAQFVYQYDANQYFTFTGDDDVYLYINGFRVLDIGGAHGMSEVTININDVAKKIGLQNGGTYSFDFFYMERHGTAANFGIETNIQIADASMHTAKQGYQNGVDTGYGGPVNAENHVGYTFELQNNGTANIYNLTFDDPNLNVHFGYDEIRPYPAGQTDKSDMYPYTIKDDLYLIRRNSAGTIVEYLKPGDVTEEILIDRLTKGLAPGETIGIYGIKYKIPEEQWVDTDGDKEGDTFINTVYTTATDGSKTLQGVADWKVVKMQHPYEAFHVYDWVHKAVSNDPADAENLTWKVPTENGIPVSNGVTVTKAELIDEYLLNGENDQLPDSVDKNTITIVPCTASGNTDEYFKNPNVSKSAAGDIIYTSKTVGKDTVFFVFVGVTDKNGNPLKVYDSLVFSYEVYTYGAVDNIYVLDYGLDVELAGKEFGFYTNDHLVLNENSIEMVPVATDMMDKSGTSLTSITAKDGAYGTFTWESGSKSLKYKPDEIINGTDEVYAKFRIQEVGDKEFSKFTGVEMVQKITTAPASVMYYEENFPGITYVSESGNNEWAHYETLVQAKDENGNLLYNEDGTAIMVPAAGTEQSANQESNYGSDPNYADDKLGSDQEEKTIVFTADTSNPNETQKELIDKLGQFLGLTSQDSNGTYNKLVVSATEEVMSFGFRGTGFEIVSRTTKDQYALIQVKVYLMDNDGKNVVVNQKSDTENFKSELPATDANGVCRTKVVITESKGGDLYQVPIIAIKDLQRGQYKVTVTASYHQKQERVLYIDGIRIYGPLSNDQALEYYSPKESGATYYEVKNLVAAYQAVVAELVEGGIDTSVQLVTGSTLIENTTGTDAVLTGDGIKLTDYLSVGPNNELYLDGNDANNLIAFFLIPDDKVSEDERTAQIGAHRKADSIAGYDSYVGMYYGSTPETLLVDDIESKPYYHKVSSGTEQYYDIDVNHLVETDGKYLVMIVAGHGGYYAEPLALTNLKVKGYTVELLQPSLYAANENGTLSEHELVKAVAEVLGVEFGGNGDGNGSGTEDGTTPETVNENLEITVAGLRNSSVASGKVANLSVTTGTEAQTIKVFDALGNEVQSTTSVRVINGDKVIFNFIWKVTGSSGQPQNFTVRVYDAEGLPSVNTMTVTVTIK